MARTRYYHNGKIVAQKAYRVAMILLGINQSSKKINRPSNRTRRSIRSPKKHVNNVVERRSSGSTSSTIVDEEQPPVNVNELRPPPDDDQPQEAAALEVGGGAPAIPLVPAMQPVVPAIPVPAIVNMIGACSPPFEKQLTKSDVTEGQGRLVLRKEFVNLHLAPMFNADEDLVDGIDVTAFDSEGRQYDMTFKVWTSKLYVLTKGWKEFFKTNNLTEIGEYVTVWMFRHVGTQKLCFAITRGRAGGP